MTEEVIKEVITSTPASPEPKCEDHLINSPVIVDGNSVPPDLKKEKPVPHYLRVSTRSCHDSCKFGIKRSSESKKYWPVCRKQLRRASTWKQELDRAEIILPQRDSPRKKDQKLKISHVKHGNATAHSKPKFTNPKAPLEIAPDHSESVTCAEDLSAEASEPVVTETLPTDAECCIISHDDVADCGDGKSSGGAESIELEMPLTIQESDASDEHVDDAILPSEDVCEGMEQSLVDHRPDQSANECAGSEYMASQAVMASEKHDLAELGIKSEISPKESVIPKLKARSSTTIITVSSQKSDRTSHPKATTTAVESSSGPKTRRKTADATATTKFSNPERKLGPTVTSTVPKVREIKVPSPSNATDASAQSARLAKLKASTAKDAPSSGKQTDRKMTVKNVVRNAQFLQKKREEKVVHGPLKLSRSVNMSAKSLPGVKLRAVKKEKIAPPIKSSNKKVSGTENSAADDKDGEEKFLKTASLKVRKPDVNNKESRPRKEKPATPRIATARRPKPAPSTSTSTVAPAPSPRKLTFRRGKVLNPDESSSSTPRRLRFRPAMGAADATVRSRGGRITSRRTGSSAAAGDAGASRAEVVVLRRRHQDGKEKQKQEQVPLNNVIEETASRLVAEARKSKVKALVGAFETVISLQETGKAAPPPPATAGVAP